MNSKIVALAGISLMTLVGLSGCSKSADDSSMQPGKSPQTQQPATDAQGQAAPQGDTSDADQSSAAAGDDSQQGDSDSDADDLSQGIPPDESQKHINHAPESDPQSGTLEGNSNNIQQDQ